MSEKTPIHIFSTFGSKINKFERKKIGKKIQKTRQLPNSQKELRPFSVNKEIEYLLQPLHESLFRIFLNFFDSLAGASIGCKLCEDKKKI